MGNLSIFKISLKKFNVLVVCEIVLLMFYIIKYYDILISYKFKLCPIVK